jgi:hypothetical protein
MLKYFSLAMTSSLALCASMKAQKADKLFLCPDGPQAMHLTVRHIEANGIGYKRGYTTAELFLAPMDLWENTYMPFLDLRAHYFNDNKWAGNAGIGMRFLSGERIWGINGYYDYRKTKHQHYNQVSAGLESLGRVWDFRINGYLPVGAKNSHYYDTQFESLQGNSIILSHKREFVMKGANGEVGIHCNPDSRNLPMYFAFGPYYLEGKGKVTWGGQARLCITLSEYLTLEGNTSYDKVFRWIGQGQAGIHIPFGGRRRVKQRKDHSCKNEIVLARRLEQRVDRFEIIPVAHRRSTATAMDLGGLEPFFVFFVDNTSHSNGTFESPFNTLLAAQNASGLGDIIIVFPGDGTSTGMNKGIALQSGQKLFSAHMPHTIKTAQGTIVIPALASTAPLLTNTNNSAYVIAATADNEIAGLNIQSITSFGSGGLLIQGPNVYIHDTTITVGNGNDAINIQSSDCGNSLIASNSIYCSDTSDTYGIFVSSSTGYLTIANNLLTGTSNASGLAIGVNVQAGTTPAAFIAGLLNVVVSDNTFNSQTNAGTDPTPCAINITSATTSMQVNASILRNVITIPTTIANAVAGLYVLEDTNAGPITLTVKDNVATTTNPTPGYSFTNNASPTFFILDYQNNIGTRTGP